LINQELPISSISLSIYTLWASSNYFVRIFLFRRGTNERFIFVFNLRRFTWEDSTGGYFEGREEFNNSRIYYRWRIDTYNHLLTSYSLISQENLDSLAGAGVGIMLYWFILKDLGEPKSKSRSAGSKFPLLLDLKLKGLTKDRGVS